MTQFDVYQLGARQVVVLQSHFLDMETCVVANLLLHDRIEKPISGLMPVVSLEGDLWVVDTPSLAAIHAHHLKHRVGSIVEHRPELMAALDLLFTGI